MIERVVARRRRRGSVRISLVSSAASFAVAALGARAAGLGTEEVVVSGLLGLTQGFLIPLAVLLLSDGLHDRPSFKRLHYLLQLLVQMLMLAGVCVAISVAGNLVVSGSMAASVRGIGATLVTGFAIALVMVVYSTLREFLGRRFLRDLALGLYGRAREEQAIVVFVDIQGSTAIAESLPPIRFFDLLNDFFALVDAYVTYHGGTIYKYLGDGAVLVWRATPANASRVLELVTALPADLAARAERYRREYGRAVDCTAGVHAGSVLVGGLGQEKRELGYWGDTLNTASRIQGLCAHYGEQALLSAEFVESLPPEATGAQSQLRRIEGVELRGKQGTRTLYSSPRAGRSDAAAPI